MIDWLSKLAIFFILVLFFFPIKLKVLPLDTPRLLYFLVLLYPFLIKKVSINQVYIFKTILAVSCITILVTIANELEDLTFLRISFEFILRYFFLASVISALCIRVYKDDYNSLLKLVILVYAFQACVMIIMILSPELQNIYFSLLDSKANDSEGFWRLRQIGLTGWAVYDMAINQLLAVFLVGLVISQEKSNKSKVIFFAVLIMLLVSAILSARTAFVGIILFFITAIFIDRDKKINTGTRSFIAYCLSLLVVICICGLIYLSIKTKSKELLFFVKWVSEIFINIVEGNVQSDSTDVLKTMYFMPNEMTFIFGDGVYVNGEGRFYGGTDVGYLRLILFFGIPGSVIFYLLFFFLGISLTSLLRRFYSLGSAYYFIITYFVFLFLVNAKGSIFIDAIPAMTTLFFLFSYFSQVKSLKFRCKDKMI